jgi:hypothetical protein
MMALFVLALAVAGVAATAGLAAAGVAISESSLVQAFEDVADGAGRMQIDLEGNAITFTNLDSGESRTVTSNERFYGRRLQFDLPDVTVRGDDGEAVIVSRGLQGEVMFPEITITDPDNGQSRVIRPNTQFNDEFRAPRVVWDGREVGPLSGLRMVGEFISGLFTLTLLALVAVVAYILLRNRSRQQAKVETADSGDSITNLKEKSG